MYYDSISKAVWIKKGQTPIRMTTGSKRKLYLFGAVTRKKKQLFLVLDDKRMKNPDKNAKKKYIGKFNWKTSLKFLYLLKNRYRRFILFWDKAGYHNHWRVKKYLRANKDCIKVVSFPTAASKLNPTEECWHQSKDYLVGSKIYDTYDEFRKRVTHYYRYKRFNLNIQRYLCP